MDGIYFYWITWIGWVWVTFIMDKSEQRLKYSFVILFGIIFSTHAIVIMNIKINVSLLFFLVIGFVLMGKQSLFKKVNNVLACFIITFAYAGILVISVYDPVWIFLPLNGIISAATVLLIIMVTKKNRQRISALLVGTAAGEGLYGFLLTYIQLHNEIGVSDYLDRLAISFISIVCWMFVEKLFFVTDQYIQKVKEERKRYL